MSERDSIEIEKGFLDVLRMFAPGTAIRASLDDLLRARMGALIVFENDKIDDVLEKGFRINTKFSSQKLVELCKMDGAIILSRDGKRILYANALLFPSIDIPTKETGTRHKAGERTAKQIRTIVIAVSERKNKISLYYGDARYELEEGSEILRRAAETLQILEKQRDMFNDAIMDLDLLEINGMVTIEVVSKVLQRLEIIKRIAEIVKRYLIELGKEGMIVSMRLKDLTQNLDKTSSVLLKDYFATRSEESENILSKMSFDFLLEVQNISRMLFEELHDRPISPRGFRILKKTHLSDKQIDTLIGNSDSLKTILKFDDKQLVELFDSEEVVEFFRSEIKVLRDKIMVGRRLYG